MSTWQTIRLLAAYRADADADGRHRHRGDVLEARQEVDRCRRTVGYRHVHRGARPQRRQQRACSKQVA